jgi:hypothetical protein
MARAKTTNPVLDGMVHVPPAARTTTVRLMVRTVAAMGELPRYRAGLGPFGREPQVLADTTKSNTGPLGLFGRVIQAAA